MRDQADLFRCACLLWPSHAVGTGRFRHSAPLFLVLLFVSVSLVWSLQQFAFLPRCCFFPELQCVRIKPIDHVELLSGFKGHLGAEVKQTLLECCYSQRPVQQSPLLTNMEMSSIVE